MKRRKLLTITVISVESPSPEEAHRAAVDALYTRHFQTHGYRVLEPIDYGQSLAWHKEALRQHAQVFANVISKFDPEVMSWLAAA